MREGGKKGKEDTGEIQRRMELADAKMKKRERYVGEWRNLEGGEWG